MNDHTIRAARPVSSLFRNRPLGTRGRQRRGRNRKSARVSRPSSVTFPAELAARGGNHKHADQCLVRSEFSSWCLERIFRWRSATETATRPSLERIFARREPISVAVFILVPGASIGRLSCPNGIAVVTSPPTSTSRADESNVGEEIERGDTSVAAPRRCSPADAAEQAGQTDARTSSKRSRLFFGLAFFYFPGGVAHAR